MTAHPSLVNDSLLDVLRLIRTPNVGPVTFFHLFRYYGSAAEALRALPELAKRGGRKKPLVACEKSVAEKEIEASERFGARMVVFGAPDYPPLLAECVDAPPLLSLCGHAQLWRNREVVAMVGARSASAAGCQLAQKLAKDLGAAGISVASGLARGIDTFAHKGSLASGTIAVIASGIDTVYPPENEALFAQIRESGCLISEQPFGQAPFAGAFPGRNRIIAGMSLATLVVEASPKSGSLITARLAAEYGREVMAVPGSPLDPRSKGCNQLIKQGAVMVEGADDVLQALIELRGRFAEPRAPLPLGFAEPTAHSEEARERARALVLEKLGYMPVAIDALVAQTHLDAPLVLAVLLELELAGIAQRSAGGKVALVAE